MRARLEEQPGQDCRRTDYSPEILFAEFSFSRRVVRITRKLVPIIADRMIGRPINDGN